MALSSLQECARRQTLVMGVLNVTPDSFYNPSRVASVKVALQWANQAHVDGAHLLDIGGESSRPGAAPIGLDEELSRVLPVLETLTDTALPLSIDTYRAETARRATALGVAMVNDITALRGDALMAEVVAESKADCVLMHMQGTPENMQDVPHYDDVVSEICAFFEERIAYATQQGIDEAKLWLDPGIGFGKTVEHNLEILRRLREFKKFGRPLLIGTSNKSMIGAVLDLPLDERFEGTAATVALAIAHGADAMRVHDIKGMSRVARMSDAIVGKHAQ